MRITLDLPENLLEAARRRLGLESTTDTVIVALRELVQRPPSGDLKALLGCVELDIDVATSRRRPGPASAW